MFKKGNKYILIGYRLYPMDDLQILPIVGKYPALYRQECIVIEESKHTWSCRVEINSGRRLWVQGDQLLNSSMETYLYKALDGEVV